MHTASARTMQIPPAARPAAPLSWLSPGLAVPHLELVFSLARIPWVRDFLLRPDPAPDLATLVGPVQVAHAWGADIRVHARHASPPFPAAPLDLDLALRVALVPALACGTLTVGVAVREVLHGGADAGRVAVGRFVRDDANGAVFVLLGLHPASPSSSSSPAPTAAAAAAAVVETLFVYHESAMRTSRYYLRFQPDAFRAAMQRHGEAFRVEDLFAALRYCTLQSEARDCPMCRSPLRALCACTLAFIPPKHSVDFAPLRANMQAMMGRFEGTGVGELYVGGEPVRLHSASKVHVAPSADAHLLQRLAMRAAQALMLAASAVPLSPPTPTAVDYAAADGAAWATAKEVNYVQSLESIIHEALAPPVEPPPPSAQLVASFLRADAQQQHQPPPPPPPHLSPVSEVAGTGSETGELKWQANAAAAAGVEVAHSPTSSQGSSGSERTRGPRRAPRRPVSEEVLREREARKQVRIFKNRAAAARSNARRKLQNDALKGALAEVRGRALQLRDRHMALREENLRLKMALLM